MDRKYNKLVNFLVSVISVGNQLQRVCSLIPGTLSLTRLNWEMVGVHSDATKMSVVGEDESISTMHTLFPTTKRLIQPSDKVFCLIILLV